MASHIVDGAQGELKQQGAIETAQNAAQDPQSNLNPEDAEKVLLDETKKAGMPAYQFNPDASPEEKAAEAQAVSCLSRLVSVAIGSSRGLHWLAWLLSWADGSSASLQGFTMRKSQRGWLS